MNQTDSGWRKRQIALDKKAENARELGLDYEPSIIEMAREAGFQTGTRDYANGVGSYPIALPIGYNTCLPELEAFAALVRADERGNANNAYKERNQLVALLSTLFPSGKAKTAIEDWDEAWHGCVYIDFPWGQASWHYHTDDDQMFSHLPSYTKMWDGHTTEAKYAAIAQAIRARGQA